MRGVRAIGAVLALSALLLYALIPPGYMPGLLADGGQGFVVCTGYGPHVMAVDGAGNPVETPAKSDKASPCAFAFASPGTPSAQGYEPILFTSLMAAALPLLQTALLTARFVPAIGPRAPPSRLL